jgi:hypothetical protein
MDIGRFSLHGGFRLPDIFIMRKRLVAYENNIAPVLRRVSISRNGLLRCCPARLNQGIFKPAGLLSEKLDFLPKMQ